MYTMRPLSKILILSFFVSLTTINLFSQPLWDAETIEKANTAKNENYLTDEEKAVLFYCNLVRRNPKLFLETYLKNHLDSTKENTKYTRSLIKTLKNTKSLAVFYPSEKLYSLAKTHSTDFGKKGKTGHGDFTKRFMAFSKDCECTVGENCDYGNDKAFNIVMSLLIDDGVPDLGHRKNILDPAYKNIGVSIQKHKKYDWNCVMDFSGAGVK